MKSNKENIHRGELLKRIVAESGISVETIIRRMNYNSRTTFYTHLKNPNLSLALLKRYGKVLKYDFSNDLEEMGDLRFEEDQHIYLKDPQSIEEAINQRDYYFKLYLSLLEDVRSLQQEIGRLKKDDLK